MKLYTYTATDNNEIYGIEETTNDIGMTYPTNTNEIITIGQRPDYSEYLVLVDTPHELMTEFDGNYDGWDFNYRQEWGLAINDEVIERVVKEVRENKLDSIIVEVNENQFDGNADARGNMVSAILASEITSITEITWKLVDNSSATVTIEDLKLALEKSITNASEILFSVVFEN